MSGNRLVALGCVLLVGACADPMSTSDGIWPTAGLAQRVNKRVHVVNPYAGTGPGPNPGGHGTRAVEVIERYQAGPAPLGAEGAAVGPLGG